MDLGNNIAPLSEGLFVFKIMKKPLTTSHKFDSNQPLSEAITSDDHASDNLLSLIEELRSVDLNDSLAKLNETTITDNNGGRIEL